MNEIITNEQKLDLVVLNAGVLGDIRRFEEQELKHAIEVMNTNVWTNKAIIDLFILSETEIDQYVAISSGAARNGSAGWGSYSISKAALNMMIQTYAAENKNSHFCSLAPGLVDTAMQDYISSISANEDMPSIQRLQLAKGTTDMPSPKAASEMLIKAMDNALGFPSGIFLDIRDM